MAVAGSLEGEEGARRWEVERRRSEFGSAEQRSVFFVPFFPQTLGLIRSGKTKNSLHRNGKQHVRKDVNNSNAECDAKRGRESRRCGELELQRRWTAATLGLEREAIRRISDKRECSCGARRVAKRRDLRDFGACLSPQMRPNVLFRSFFLRTPKQRVEETTHNART